MRLLIVGLISLLTASFHTSANNSFYYVGAAVQSQNVELPDFAPEESGEVERDIENFVNMNFNSYSEGTPYRLILGYQYSDYFAIEAGYTEYLTRGFTMVSNDIPGRVDLDGSSESMSVDIKTILTVPLTNKIAARAALGAVMWDNETDVLTGTLHSPELRTTSDNGVELLMSVGMSYAFNKSISVMADWDKRSINGSSVDSIGLAVVFSL